MTATVTGETFDPAMISGFPEPAHRWLRHAIAPGTPLWASVELTMHGRIKLGRWRPFTARQVLSPPGGYPFGVRVEDEACFDGITIPSVLRASWWWGTERQHEGEFFRAEITGAVFS
ncbi:MAG TPA: DUF6544 family protein [Streptosporangiaceae bacterium]|nr:DUF6544 family protein [Streptosporangiaceae bacterium]